MALAGRAAGEGGDGGRWWRGGVGGQAHADADAVREGLGNFGRELSPPGWLLDTGVLCPGLAPRGEFSGGEGMVVRLSLARSPFVLRFPSLRLSIA